MRNIDLIEPRNANMLSHAYIASPPLVNTLAQAAVCSATGDTRPCLECIHCDKASRGIHPDINFVSKLKDKKEITIEQIRDLRKSVIVIPNDAAKSVYIIEDADTMNKSSQNALLQMLEEPPPHVMFILSTKKAAALLPTVRSRCAELTALPQQPNPDSLEISEMHELADEFFTSLESGNYELVSFMFKLEKLDKDSMTKFIETAENQATARLRAAISGSSDNDNGKKYKTLALTERILSRAGEMLELNVSTGHISGMICAGLLGI